MSKWFKCEVPVAGQHAWSLIAGGFENWRRAFERGAALAYKRRRRGLHRR